MDRKSEYHVSNLQSSGVLEPVNVVIEYEVESILRKDSLDMTDEVKKSIYGRVKSKKTNRIVITHGTDNMIETGKVLCEVSGKTVVLTGSMYPAELRDSDAIINIGCAITAAQILPQGVYIAMNGKIFDPDRARKNVEKNRFEEI